MSTKVKNTKETLETAKDAKRFRWLADNAITLDELGPCSRDGYRLICFNNSIKLDTMFVYSKGHDSYLASLRALVDEAMMQQVNSKNKEK